MKKVVILIITIVIILLGIGGGLYYYKYQEKPTKVNKPKIQEVEGMVFYVNDNEITLRDNKGQFYQISKTDEQDISAGNIIKIKYENKLTNNNIKSINIEAIEKESIPDAWNDQGIFKDYYQVAFEKLKTLTIEEKIGQLMLVRVPDDNQINAIKDYHLGGYLLFGQDTKNQTKNSLKSKIENYQNASSIPMIIAVDEEGGKVNRISTNPNLRPTKFLSPQEIYKNSGFEGITSTVKEMSDLLSSLTVNVDLAPVADVSINPEDFIYARAFGQDAENTAKYIETVLDAGKDGNVSYVLKHFPGYGNNRDTHTQYSIDNRSLEEFEQSDFLPFKAGIDKGAEAIMVNHNIVTVFDKENPASLSWLVHKQAIDNLGFSGILMTDDLDMAAIKENEENFVVKSIIAGNQLLILSDYEKATQEIKTALENKEISQDLIDYDVFKILSWKYFKGLIK